MADHYSNNDQHQRYNERLAKLEERSILALNNSAKRRKPLLKKQLPNLKQFRLKRNLQRIISVVLPFSLILLFMLYIISPLARINQVVVSGNHHLTDQEIEQATQVKKGRFIWGSIAMSPARLQKIQTRNAQIKSVKIVLTGMRSVDIRVKEYDVIGLINVGNQPKLLLSNGKVRPVTGHLEQFIAYDGFKNHYGILKLTAKEVGRLKPAIRNGISEVTYSPTTLDMQRLKLVMNDGNTVFVRADTLAEKMSYYPSIVANTNGKGIINLEFGAYSYGYSSKAK